MCANACRTILAQPSLMTNFSPVQSAVRKDIDASYVLSDLIPTPRKYGGQQRFVQAIEECVPHSCIASECRSG